MTTVGKVRQWLDDEGWGVIDSPETPGGCWSHFSSVVTAGYESLAVGQSVSFDWEVADQDGFSFRAVVVRPVGGQSAPDPVDEAEVPRAYGSELHAVDPGADASKSG